MNMPFTRPILDEESRIDFYAGTDAAYEWLKSVWDALPKSRQGIFYRKDFGNHLVGYNPLVITNPSDLMKVFYAGEERPFFLIEFEHHTPTHGLLSTVSLFLCKEAKTAKIRKAFASKDQTVASFTTPKSAADTLIKYVVGAEPKFIDKCGSDSIGLIYMAFGDKARAAVQRSVATLKRLGFAYPVCVVGDGVVKNARYNIEWKRESPFDTSQKRNFQFRAGRIKPFLYDLSPFDRTLYLDADTEFVQDPFSGFKMLDKVDAVFTKEYLTVGELYNKYMAGWEINIQERDQTIKEGVYAGDAFLNSGVIFFKKGEATKKLFFAWYKEWLRFQQWDEQLALMRAIKDCRVSIARLEPAWNDPQLHPDTVIFHNYGSARIRESR